MKFINDYPYTNMTAQNIDWLIKAVVDLIHQGKTDEEIKNAPGISEAYGAFCNAYPYTNMTMQNIDWLIGSVRELYDKEATLEETVTKIEAQMKTLQADVNNIAVKLDDKVDKTTEPAKIYGTDLNGMPFLYTQTATETTLYSVPLRNENGAIVAAAAQQGDEVVNLTQMDTALEGKVNKTKTPNQVYGTDQNGMQSRYDVSKNASSISVVQRTESGTIKAANPTQDNELTTKKYVDDGLVGKLNKTTEPAKIYGTGPDGEPHLYEQNASELIPWSIPIRNGNGAIVSAIAGENDEVVTLVQMNAALAGKVNKTTARQIVYARDSAGNESALSYDSEATVGVAVRGQNGVLKVGTPVANDDATTKEYVDDAIATAPVGGWVTVIDKTWTEDETVDSFTTVNIPAKYQKAMSELRMTYYNNTPQAGAVYSTQKVDIRLYDGEHGISFMYTGNILPTQDTKEVTVNFQSVENKRVQLYGSGGSDLYNNCYGIFLFRDSNGNAVQPIPTDPNALLNTSKIIGIPSNETGEYVLNSCLPNRSHSYLIGDTQTTVNYTSNDYYNSEMPDCIVSQILTSTDTTNLPVGAFISVERSDLKFAMNVSISFTATTSVSYKNVVTRLASIVGETLQVIAGADSNQNQMTSFDDISRNGNPLPSGGYAYYSHINNGYPTRVYLYPQSSTSNGVTAKKIYAGSRLVLQARY